MKYLKQIFSIRIISYVIIILLVFVWMNNWFVSGIPANPREESINDISWLWTLHKSSAQNVLTSSWNPLMLTGNTNYLQRGYFLLAPLAFVTTFSKFPVELVYSLAVAFTFIFSGISMYEYVRKLGSSPFGGVIASVAYMFLPPHLTLGLDALEFNAYWALIPTMSLLILNYIQNDKPIFFGSLIGILFTLSLMTGTTYFIATLPFLLVFWGLQVYFAKQNSSRSVALLLTVGLLFFLGSSAYILVPILIEMPYMWISQESQRKNIFSILSFKEIADLFLLRLKVNVVSVWNLNRNHPDLGFYLSWPISLLALFSLTRIVKYLKQYIPFIFLLIIFAGFVSLRFSLVHLGLKFLVLTITSLRPEIKILVIALSFCLIGISTYKYYKKSKNRVHFSQLLLVIGFLIVFILFTLNINKFQATYDHTVRLFLFPTFVLAVFSSWGIDQAIKKISIKYIPIFYSIIFGLVIFDLIPFAQFFKKVDLSISNEDKSVYKMINDSSTQGRFYAPFPFKKHLPMYRYEYFTHLVNRWRLNNENVYTPFTPLYSTHLYDVILLGALEQNKIDPSFFMTILNWSNTNFVVLRNEVSDYSNIINFLYQNSWETLAQSKNVIALVNTQPSSFFKTYSNFQPIPKNKKMDPLFWFDKSKQNISLYDTSDLHEFSFQKSEAIKQLDSNILSWKRSLATEIQADIEAHSPTLLVTSEAWYPGWHVYIDNQSSQLVRANYASLGVIVPPGIHTIIFKYSQPFYYKIGQLISLMSIFGLVFIVHQNIKMRRIT